MKILGGINIMAVGDSNTYGFGAADVVHDGSWRYYFGIGVVPYLKAYPNWVGDNPALGVGVAGNKMLGAIGQRIDQILGTYDAANQFALKRPDLAILMIGVNDCNQIYSGSWSGGSIAISIANMSTLLDVFRTANPTKYIIVSKLPPSTTSGVNDQIVLWNAALDAMISARSDKDFIFIADLYTAFTNNASWSTDYMWNFLHYNSAGQELIAATFISVIASNITTMPRASATFRRSIRPHVASLRHESTSTADILGTGTTLDTSKPWAVSFDINIERRMSGNHGILCLKTDQATPFVFLANTNNTRFLEFGSSANFGRFFPPSSLAGDVRSMIQTGWHNVIVTFDGVNRTALSSYKLYVDGINIPVTSGTGFSASTNQNAIGVVGGLTNGTFDIADLTIWNDGSAMTQTQAEQWFSNYIIPTGPTLIRRYKFEEGAGSTITDATGNQNGTVGTATWSSNIPTTARSAASDRSVADARSSAT